MPAELDVPLPFPCLLPSIARTPGDQPEHTAPLVSGSERPNRCPFALGWYRRCEQTGEVRYFRCERNRCPFCLRVNAWLTGRAIADQQPERFITLTLVGDDWQTVRGRMYRVRHDIAAMGYRSEWAWFVEVNPKGTGHHVHALQHGDFVPLDDWWRAVDRNGMGHRVVPERIRGAESAAAYAGKAAGYVAKESVQSLALNGGRVGHYSRGYWRSPGGKREALRRVTQRFLEDEREAGFTWVIEPESGVDSSSSSAVRTDTGSSSTWLRPGRIVAPTPTVPGC